MAKGYENGHGTFYPIDGGTGREHLTQHAVIVGGGQQPVTLITIGTGGRMFVDQGAGADPAFVAMSGDGTLAADGTLTVATMVGDSGSGGTKGLVPAPAAGDAAAGKFLKADGTWAVGGGGLAAVVDDTSPELGGDLGLNGHVITGMVIGTDICSFSDSRLSNARTPTAHASTHQNGGADEVATATAAANAIPKAGSGGTLDKGWLPTMIASGASHAAGAVPDPGASAGSTKFLREDATWAVPAGGGNTIGFGAEASIPVPGTAGDAYFPTDNYLVQIASGTAWLQWGPIFPFTSPGVFFSVTSTWLNQGSAAVVDSGGSVYLSCVSNGTADSLRGRYKSIPATTKKTQVAFIPHFTPGTNQGYAGFFFYESSSGKCVFFNVGNNSSAQLQLGVYYYSAPGTFGSSLYNKVWTVASPLVWLQAQYDGTNITFWKSDDGQNWDQLYQEAVTAHFSTAPDKNGIALDPYAAATAMTCLHYAEV